MPDPNKKQEDDLLRFERESKIRQRQRLSDYEKAYGQKPNIPTTDRAKEIYRNINKTEPYFKTAMAAEQITCE